MPDLLANTRKVIEDTFKTAWANTTPVRFQNVPFKQPAGEFVWLSTAWANANQASMGDVKLTRQTGIAVLIVNVPVDTGSDRALKLAQQFIAVFQYKQKKEGTTVVNFYEGSVGNEGQGQTHFSLKAAVRFTAEDNF